MSLTGGWLNVASRADARARLLSDLATGPARKAYSVAYDLLGNRAEAEKPAGKRRGAKEAVQEGLARACEAIDDLRDPEAAPAWFLRIVTTMSLRTLRRRKLRRALLGWLPGGKGGTEPTAAPATAAELAPPRDDIAERMHGAAAPAASQQLAVQQELGALLGRLDQLSAQQRTALVLRYGHD